MSGAKCWKATKPSTITATITPSRTRLALLVPRSCTREGRLSEALRRRDDRVRVAGRQRRARGVGGDQVGEQPDRGRTRAADQGAARRRPRRARPAPRRSRAQRDRRLLEVVDEQLGVVERRRAGGRGLAQPRRRAGRAPRRSGRARASRPRRRPRPSRARRRRRSARPRTRPAPAAARPSPPRRRPARTAGRAARARRRPSPAAIRGRSSSSPAASRRTAAASALPPPSPAATGIRLSISTRSGGRSQPRARIASSATPTRFGPSTPAQTTSSRPRLEPRSPRSGRRAAAGRTASAARAGRRRAGRRGRGRG